MLGCPSEELGLHLSVSCSLAVLALHDASHLALPGTSSMIERPGMRRNIRIGLPGSHLTLSRELGSVVFFHLVLVCCASTKACSLFGAGPRLRRGCRKRKLAESILIVSKTSLSYLGVIYRALQTYGLKTCVIEVSPEGRHIRMLYSGYCFQPPFRDCQPYVWIRSFLLSADTEPSQNHQSSFYTSWQTKSCSMHLTDSIFPTH